MVLGNAQVTVLEDLIARYSNRAMIAPIIEPTIPAAVTSHCPSNRRFPRKPPTNDPINPKTKVPSIPIESDPGTNALAIRPAIRPTSSHIKIPIRFPPGGFGWTTYPFGTVIETI
jgi:hypothetical protein